MSLTLVIIVVAIYFAAMILIGFAGKKHATTFEGFSTGGRNLGVMMLIGSLVGAHIGNGFVVGVASAGASQGIGGAWYGVGCGLSYLVVVLVFRRKLYDKGFVTVGEWLEWRYKDHSVSLIYSVVYALSGIGIVCGQIIAGRALFEAFGMNGTVEGEKLGEILHQYKAVGRISL